ncbi:MAG: NUDIX domain-containing protein [Candidatus Latescibacteria bacterium]|nr:NUDIX domain-containing protein [Candidatus Latescibacterota bacterium]
MSLESDTPHVYHGAYGLCRDLSDRLLLVRVASGLDEGRWTMPGGGIEWGEHPDTALLRELEEETGAVDIRAFQLATVFSHIYMRSIERPYDSVHHIGIIYDVTLDTFELVPEKEGSTDRCDWFTQSQARQLPLVPLSKFAVDLIWPKSEHD